MAELALCVECNRHVRGAECPFCGARAEGAKTSPLGRVSRAAMLALAASAPACKNPATVTMYGGPPSALPSASAAPESPSASAPASDAPAASAVPTASAAPAASSAPTHAATHAAPPTPPTTAAAYGGPPPGGPPLPR